MRSSTTYGIRCATLAVAGAACCFLSPGSSAQTSASYKLTESTINAGGDPSQGTSLASSHYHVRLDAIGDSVVGANLASASFKTDEGFVADYPPPGEVAGLQFGDKTTLRWNPDRSVGAYELYRDLVSTLPGSFGTCFSSGLPGETATDPSSPAVGAGYFYLVTARNRLLEEGTKGFQTGGAERGNPSPCP